MEAIAAPLDFLGLNNYSRMFVRADPDGGLPLTVRAAEGELTDMGWEIYPDALCEGLVRLHEEYDPPPLYVSESGAAFSDVLTHDGAVHDLERIAYLDAYLDSATRAVERGVDLRGFFVWSLLDNFEWSLGYAKRFGLVYVDYPTLERTPKDSFHWYAERIRRA
jgi:beta-glucosidase